MVCYAKVPKEEPVGVLSSCSFSLTRHPGENQVGLEKGPPGLLHPEALEPLGGSETSKGREAGLLGEWGPGVRTHLALLDHMADYLPGTRLQALVG